ncbi:MAG: PEGA domain-containing protein [Candidatus Omnitrophota bacterium]
MLIFRKILFYVFVLIYVIACPIIILYAYGYILKPQINEPVVVTGDISLASLPTGASIYLNSTQTGMTTPVLIDKLRPGKYSVEISMDGWLPWAADFPVKAGKVTVLEDILLVPREPDISALTSKPLMNLRPVSGKVFIVAESPALSDYFVFDTKVGEGIPVVSGDSEYAGCEVRDIHTVEGSASVVFEVMSGGVKKFIWAGYDGTEVKVKDITDVVPGDMRWLTWDPNADNVIFSFGNGRISYIDVTWGGVYPDFVTGARGLGVNNRQVYVVSDDCAVYSVNYDGKVSGYMLDDEELGKSVFGETESFRIMAYANNIFVFLGDDGRLITNHLPYLFADKVAGDIKFSGDKGTLMFRTKTSIGTVDFLDEDISGVFEKGPKLVWVKKDGSDIKDIFWADKGSHALCLDKGVVSLIDVQYDGVQIVNTLTAVKDNTGVAYDDDPGILYYLDARTGTLMSLKVIPDQNPAKRSNR